MKQSDIRILAMPQHSVNQAAADQKVPQRN